MFREELSKESSFLRQRNLVGRMYMLQVIENIVLQETVTDF